MPLRGLFNCKVSQRYLGKTKVNLPFSYKIDFEFIPGYKYQNKMSIEFYCRPDVITAFTSAPTAEQIRLYGGRYNLQNKTFHLNNGQTATSPSGACKLCLQREGVTNEWRGPYHLAMEIDGRWVPYAATQFYNRPTQFRIA